REIQTKIEEALQPLAALCDLITAERATRYLGNESIQQTVYDMDGRNPKIRKRSVPHHDRILLSANQMLLAATTAEDLERAIVSHPQLESARKIALRVSATHMPVRFPEVFRRNRPGFDCILGNPPWEKLKVEEHSWWALRFPGLRSMSQQDKNDTIK